MKNHRYLCAKSCFYTFKSSRGICVNTLFSSVGILSEFSSFLVELQKYQLLILEGPSMINCPKEVESDINYAQKSCTFCVDLKSQSFTKSVHTTSLAF